MISKISKRKPVKFLIIGRSSSGKSSIAKAVCEKLNLKLVISYTTRPMRPGETNYADHIFINDNDVNKYKDDIAAYTEINGYKYFTTYEIVDQSDIYIIDPNGVLDLKNNLKDQYDFIEIYIRCPINIATERAIQRGDDLTTFMTRYKSENQQFSQYEKSMSFDFHLLNDRSFDEAVNKVVSWITLEKQRRELNE